MNKTKTMINSKKTVRESGVELLRILAAMGVIVSHYCNYNSAFASTHLSGWGGKLQLASLVTMSYGLLG